MKKVAVVGYAFLGASLVGLGMYLIHPAACALWTGGYILFDSWRMKGV